MRTLVDGKAFARLANHEPRACVHGTRAGNEYGHHGQQMRPRVVMSVFGQKNGKANRHGNPDRARDVRTAHERKPVVNDARCAQLLCLR
jgi:hypothetical protein